MFERSEFFVLPQNVCEAQGTRRARSRGALSLFTLFVRPKRVNRRLGTKPQGVAFFGI